MFYHGSPVVGIQTLLPHVSNHGKALVYLTSKPENTLVYLSNAVERFCRETGVVHTGPYYTWASYGFDHNGKLVLEEYYPHATEETYRGAAGYIYSAEEVPGVMSQPDIPGAFVTEQPVKVTGCTFIPDAYEAILAAVQEGKILLRRYEDNPPQMMDWLRRTIREEYAATDRPEYRAFLKAKFPFVSV